MGLIPRRSRHKTLPGPMLLRSAWLHDRLDTKESSPPRCQDIHGVLAPRQPHGLGTLVSIRRGPIGRDGPLGCWRPRLSIKLGPQALDPSRERETSLSWQMGGIGTKGSRHLADPDRWPPLIPTSPGGLKPGCIRHIARRCDMIPIRDWSLGNWVHWYDGPLESLGNRAAATRWGIRRTTESWPPGGQGGEDAQVTLVAAASRRGPGCRPIRLPETPTTGSRSRLRHALGRVPEKILFYPIDMTDSEFA
jgi:hypothetical protein